jgi:RNA-directed DNA polymerase
MGRPSPRTVSAKLRRIAELAREAPDMAFTSLAHHVDLEFLKEAHGRVRKDGATGVDRVTAEEYGKELEANLQRLLDRLKSGTYRAPPVRRVHIPKGDGSKTRPIGIPTFEDKIAQRAIAMLLEAVYEQDFLNCSYGFRPGRSQHQALHALREGLKDMQGGWVLEVDIKGFFDALDHRWLREFLSQRVRDGVVSRLIGKWLHAGVMEDGSLSYPESGTPQGGVVSPILANVYLHEVVDVWFERAVKPQLTGRSFMVRFADDFVMVFASAEDARRMREELLPERLGKHGLTLHPDKTRIVRFLRPRYGTEGKGKDGDGERPGTFDFLGFTHHWGKSQRGGWAVMRVTAGDRFRRALKRVADWCRANRHLTIAEQQRGLRLKLNGHYQYYGLTGNWRALARFLQEVQRAWRYWLDRRSQKARMTWERFKRLLQRYPLPPARVAKSALRLAAKP